jgi:hypothetical protein
MSNIPVAVIILPLGPISKHQTKLKMLASDKHLSLF